MDETQQPSVVIFSTLKRSPANVESLCLTQAATGFITGIFSTEICGAPKWLISIVNFVPTFLRSVPISQFCIFLSAHFISNLTNLTNSPKTLSNFYLAPIWNIFGTGASLLLQNNFSLIRNNLEIFLNKFKTHSEETEILSIVYFASPFVFYTMGNILGRRCAPFFQTWVQDRIGYAFYWTCNFFKTKSN